MTRVSHPTASAPAPQIQGLPTLVFVPAAKDKAALVRYAALAQQQRLSDASSIWLSAARRGPPARLDRDEDHRRRVLNAAPRLRAAARAPREASWRWLARCCAARTPTLASKREAAGSRRLAAPGCCFFKTTRFWRLIRLRPLHRSLSVSHFNGPNRMNTAVAARWSPASRAQRWKALWRPQRPHCTLAGHQACTAAQPRPQQRSLLTGPCPDA